MKIWAVSNQKGGVGKTTTAVTLAAWLALRGQKVLMVDLDPHGSLTTYFGYEPDDLSHSVYELFQQAANKTSLAIEPIIMSSRFEHLDLLPSSTAIATLDKQLGSKDGMGLVLARSLQSLQGQYDFILIDCPPMLGVLMINALAACEKLLIPVQTEFLAVKGLERMLNTLTMINKAKKQALDYTIIPTMYDRRTRASIETLRDIQQKFERRYLSAAIIPVDTRFREAAMKSIPLPMMNPNTRGATAYNLVLDGLLA